MELYNPQKRTTVTVTHNGKAHRLDRHGRPLCGAGRGGRAQQATLDADATCGWCKLIAGEDSTVREPAGEDSTVREPAGEDSDSPARLSAAGPVTQRRESEARDAAAMIEGPTPPGDSDAH